MATRPTEIMEQNPLPTPNSAAQTHFWALLFTGGLIPDARVSMETYQRRTRVSRVKPPQLGRRKFLLKKLFWLSAVSACLPTATPFFPCCVGLVPGGGMGVGEVLLAGTWTSNPGYELDLPLAEAEPTTIFDFESCGTGDSHTDPRSVGQ